MNTPADSVNLAQLALALLSICIITVDGRQRGSKEKLVDAWIIILPFLSLEFNLAAALVSLTED